MNILNTMSLESSSQIKINFDGGNLSSDAGLRDGTMYCSKDADIFMKSLLDEFIYDFPDMPLYLRGDSGFASPDLYEVLWDKNCKFLPQ